MNFFYKDFEHNIFLSVLKNSDIICALAYMVDYKKHYNFTIIPKEFSVELSNNELTIAIILYVGFEGEEYEALKNRKNLHIVAFSSVVPEMIEFKDLNVKFIDNTALLFTVLSLSDFPLLRDLNRLRRIEVNLYLKLGFVGYCFTKMCSFTINSLL